MGLGQGAIAFVPCGRQFALETEEDGVVIFQAGLPRHAHGAA
jgi:hypothetical protein